MNFLNPKSDLVLKRLFGTAKHENITIDFLNNILNLTGHQQIVAITFMSTEHKPERLAGKTNMFDIYCKDAQDRHFIIEMQLLNEYNFIPRSQCYAARALSLQLTAGDNFNQAMPVIFIGIVNYNLFTELDDSDQVISVYTLHNKKTLKELKPALTSYYFIELPKFNKRLNELQNSVDRWLYFFQHAHEFHEVPVELVDLQQAFTALDEVQWSYLDLEKYSKEQEAIDRARRQQEGAAAAAEEKGAQEKAQAVAINMLQEGFSVALIVKMTGLSVEQIEQLSLKN